jgi:hypothetical protein
MSGRGCSEGRNALGKQRMLQAGWLDVVVVVIEAVVSNENHFHAVFLMK